MQQPPVHSNMVANQSYLMKPKELLKKLKKGKNKQYFVNTKEWSQSVKSCFNTFGLSVFLNPTYCIPVPKGGQWVGMFQGKVNNALSSNEAYILKEKRAVVKKEKSELETDVEKTPVKAKADSRAKLEELNEKEAGFKKIVARNAAWVVEE